MARFERSKPRRDSRDSSRSTRGRMGLKGHSRRDSGSFSRDRGELKLTKVTCDSCGKSCEVPFRPTGGKPVYCRDCFEKKDKVSPDKPSDRDIDLINEKLNKIMKALNIK